VDLAELTRERWSGRAFFLFAAMGSAIGLGNIWRFPYLTYEYGGGAFLIAWMIGLIVLGIPWMMMEFGMGRLFQKGAPGVFEGIGKKWEWLGWWPVFVAFLIVTYYAVIIAWSLNFAVDSATLAWGTGIEGATTAAGGYFYGEILHLSSGPTALGGLQWPVVGALAFVWVVLFFIMFKGARIIGKVAVWTVAIPWALLVVLLIRGLTLPGAVEGLNYYLAPDWGALANPDLWFGAFSQIAFTLSLGMAGMFAYGSFIAKKGDINNNAFITSFSNCATSFFAGFAVFSVLGFLAQALSVSVPEVTTYSLGLVFLTYPAAISMMPAMAAVTGVIFFICLFFLGIDSAFFLSYGGVIAPLRDKFGWGRAKVTAFICALGLVVGLLFTTAGGLYWLDIVDHAVSFYGLLITGALACIVVGWVYGADKLREHINSTSDFKVGAWFDWLIKIVVPAGLLFVVIYGGFRYDIPDAYSGYQIGPFNGSHIVWLILAVTLGLSFWLQAAKTRGPKEVKPK
jgi:NSS family neurotransmitter:Na+ symporter